MLAVSIFAALLVGILLGVGAGLLYARDALIRARSETLGLRLELARERGHAAAAGLDQLKSALRRVKGA